MCVRKRVLTEKCGPFDSSIHSADNMQSKNLTFFKHNSNCSQRGMDMSQPQTRMTRQRMVILEELRKVKTHPTADELYAMVRTRMPRISLGTVYRNLDFLTESKEILKLESAGSAVSPAIPAPISMCAAGFAAKSGTSFLPCRRLPLRAFPLRASRSWKRALSTKAFAKSAPVRLPEIMGESC